jgi:ligand-binding sensor domain-containing protein/class 3 adenylate cyclase/HD superfamily phosphodiesterase
MIRIRSSFFIVFLLFLCSTGNAQTGYRFRNFTITNGLSQSSVTTIQQDFTNALWIGTQDGLNKFDGYEFEVFNSDDTEGLENEFIKCSAKTKDGKLWFGTNNGLTVYNPFTESFETYGLGANFPMQIEAISVDENEKLWLATSSHGIQLFNSETRKFEGFKRRNELQNVKHILVLNQYKVLVNTADYGVQLWNPYTNKLKTISFPENTDFPQVNRIIDMGKSRIFLATNQGVFQYDSRLEILRESFPELKNIFGKVNVTDLYTDKGTWYFTSGNAGLFTIRNDGSIFNSSQDIYQKHALLFNEINTIFRDQSGTFWVGTERGLSNFDASNQGFYSVGPVANLKQGLPSASVWCFGEDPSGEYLFIGTDNALSRYDRRSGVYDHFYRHKEQDKKGDKNESTIFSMHVIDEGRVLVGCADGLYELRINSSNNYQFVPLYTNLNNQTNMSWVYSLVYWRDDKIFLGTKGGVVLYDLITKERQLFVNNPKNRPNTIISGVCRFVYKDINGKMWFTTSGGGLNYLRDNGDELAIVPYERNDILARYSKDYFTSILHSSSDEYWIGTVGSGVVLHNMRTRKTEVFDKSKGLPNNLIYGILSDRNGRIWMSTNKGLSCLDPTSKETQNYTEIDGLMSNEMNLGAYMNASSENLYFGGIYGFNYFDPINLSHINKNIKVIFSKIKLDGDWLHPETESTVLSKSMSLMKELTLDHNQRSFTIRFQASDVSNPELINFKYILEGSDEQEIFLGTDNEIHFNALTYGSYELKVYARKGAGDWSKVPATLKLKLSPPFWLSWWFFVVCGTIFILIIALYIRFRLDSERREQVLLEIKINERTRELREQSKKIEKQKGQIEEERNKVVEKQRLLQIEKDKSEKLLVNIIPSDTLEELKRKGKVKARAYKKVSVIFSDFVGFTKISDALKPTELVEKLDFFFTKFDEIIEKNNLEKIKTIGDAYMAAGGVPVRNNSNPIEACLAGLQIQDFVASHKIESVAKDEETWDLRLGINTGEVTAGVIGTKKFAYDIWGASVNKAQRMEILGEPGKVTITGNTYRFISAFFDTTFKGKVQSKSRGLIEMYTVDRIKLELSVDGKGIEPNENFKKVLDLHIYSSINYVKAEERIMKILEQELDLNLYYHCLEHTRDVTRAAESIAIKEGVTDEALFLLKSAATYHDAGFVKVYDDNEVVGAQMAAEILPEYGYTSEQVATVKELIFVTRIPHKPKNQLEKIICDADLDYLGRNDFHQISERLCKELMERGKIKNHRHWDEVQVSFFKLHKYFTATSKKLRNAKKKQNLKEIQERLVKNEYKN